MNAPFTWPNSSLSNTPSDRPPAFTVTSGRVGAAETAWSACATVPLPVPFSPVIRTFASDGPTRAISSSTGRIAADSAMQRRLRRPAAQRAVLGLEPLAAPQRAAELDLRADDRRAARSFSHGFWTKSRAPRRIASTATSTLPHAVITTTGSGVSSCCSLREQVEPFLARRGVARVVQIHQRRRRSRARRRRAGRRRGDVAVSIS